MKSCPHPGDYLHTADTTPWFRLAYGTPLPLWRVIPHKWVTRPCPTAAPYAEGWRDGHDQALIDAGEAPLFQEPTR